MARRTTAPPKLAGPRQLAEWLLNNLRQHPLGNPFSFSDSGFRRLVELAFYASMAPEEGRFPRFNLAVKSSDFAWVLAKLDVALPSVDALRRLAPTCQGPDDALWITQNGRHLRCSGLLALDPLIRLPTAETAPVSTGSLTIVVRTLGPGHLSVEGLGTAELRAGRLLQRRPFSMLPPVVKFFDELARAIQPSPPASPQTPWLPLYKTHAFLVTTLRNVLRGILAEGHGGCVAILPSSPPLATVVELKFKVDPRPSLAESVKDHINATNARFASGNTDFYGQLPWMKVEALAHTVARAANVDGCVVLDATLSFCGFGGKIVVSDDDKALAADLFDEGKKVGPIKTSLQSMGGNRHQSALRLCAKVPNATVFVISQDGELTLFHNDGSGVQKFSELGPDAK